VIAGSLELVRMRLPDPSAVEWIDRALAASHRGSWLTRNLLAFARPQRLHPVPTDVNAVVTTATALLGRLVEERIEIDASLEPSLPSALVDPVGLETALFNLVLNARDAMPDGGIVIVTTSLLRDAEALEGRDAIVLSVADTGTGIDPGLRERVFEPFFTTKPSGIGAGLGLSMVRAFATRSAGAVTLDSEPGRGARFSLHLPVADPTQGSPAGVVRRTPTAKGEVLLLVEDDDDLRDVMAPMLASIGYEVHAVRTAAEAIERLDGGLRPDVLLSDVVLTGHMSGVRLAEEVERRLPATGVVLMSGHAADDVLPHASGRKRPLLSKPFRTAELAQTLRSVLNLRR
jgi:CheY-like chemotaxis protein